MSTDLYRRILHDIGDLSSEERRQLAEELTAREHEPSPGRGSPQSWDDIRGTLPYPACGEDAQEWVSRTRRESDARREIR